LHRPSALFGLDEKERCMDFVFLGIVIALYALTHALIWALSRLGRIE